MKQFSLEEYLKDPNKKVVEGHGWPVRIICTDMRDSDGNCVVGLVSKDEDSMQWVCTWAENGRRNIWVTSKDDLFFEPIKREGWVNIFNPLTLGIRTDECVYDSYEEAVDFAKRNPYAENYVATVKVEWEK